MVIIGAVDQATRRGAEPNHFIHEVAFTNRHIGTCHASKNCEALESWRRKQSHNQLVRFGSCTKKGILWSAGDLRSPGLEREIGWVRAHFFANFVIVFFVDNDWRKRVACCADWTTSYRVRREGLDDGVVKLLGENADAFYFGAGWPVAHGHPDGVTSEDRESIAGARIVLDDGKLR